MSEKHQTEEELLNEVTSSEYKYGFTTDIESDTIPKGISEEVVRELKNIMTKLQPRHGLCIDANCAPCRVQEEAIKEHVLLYVDWKVPGTVAKLEQARHLN